MSLIPAKYNLSCWAGGTFRTTITVLSGASGSTPQDLTNYSGTMNLRTAPNTTPEYVLSTTNGGVTLGGIAGTVALYIPATTTASFTWRSAIYDLYITQTAAPNDVDPILWGVFTISGIA